MTPNARRWRDGLIGAAISGGSLAVVVAGAAAIKDPKDWADLGHMLFSFFGTFTAAALFSIAKYLWQHPLWNGEERRPDGVPNGNTDTTDH